ncbi:MAG TPA: SUMF1/EgtB/PvdO family nonheme iron enzyme [Labilithrix sp.]
MKRALVLLALAACSDTVHVEPAQGEVLLYVDTDAPLAVAPDAPDASTAPPPLFDRLSIEIFPPGATTPCAGCVNAFDVDTDLFRTAGASVGIAPTPGEDGWRARVRLFGVAHTFPDGSPDPAATIERVVALPAVADTGKIAVTVVLATDDVGKTAPLDAPTAPDADGAPSPSAVGTWPGATRVDCADAAPAGMVCVPGGAFWMGDEHRVFTSIPGHDGFVPRLVVLAPFFMDATEVTVARFRAAGQTTLTWSGGSTGDRLTDFCTWTASPGPFEQRPLECIRQLLARATCKASGGDLPTEAQYEYVLGALVSHTFPWGEDLPSCDDAIHGRTGWGIFAGDSAECITPAPPGGPTDVGRGRLDRLALAGGEIVDLAGNVAEWARDDWNRHDEPCWSGAGVLHDPVCHGVSAADGAANAVRGGDWLVPGGELQRVERASAPTSTLTPEIGFRCVRKATPL